MEIGSATIISDFDQDGWAASDLNELEQTSEYSLNSGSIKLRSENTAPSPRDSTEKLTPTFYQKLPQVKETYLAYVVAIRDPLNFHLDIYWPDEISDRYSSSIRYDYTFVSEELTHNIYVRPAYSCHLRGVEIIQNAPNDFSNMKEAYILISKRILRSGGWVLVSVSDIDVYRRILVNIFDVITRKSLNQELLDKPSNRTGEPIAKEYIRPNRTKSMFAPQTNVPKDYYIIYETGSPNQ